MKWDNETLNFDDFFFFFPVETVSLPGVKTASSRGISIPSEKINLALSKETIMTSQDSCLAR